MKFRFVPKWVRQKRKYIRLALVGSLFFALVFAVYLFSLYRHLDRSFGEKNEFIPTRIYSDVSRVFPAQPRAAIEERLKALGYQFEKDDEKVQFTLHPINFPTYLIPESHPTLADASQPVILQFDSDDDDALLQSIRLGETEIPDLYLEPELVATLSRGTPDERREIRELVRFEDIPTPVWKAIIAVEDQHFLEHRGFDPRGLARAVLVNLRTRSFAQGGSTITQQLVKNLTARREKSIIRKINELFLALLLEVKYSKEEILERYLNEVYLGQVGNLEIHGVAEGAKYFFGKRLEDLNLAEIALIAGLIRGPWYYSPYRNPERAMERQKLVLQKMVETGQIAEGEAEEAIAFNLRLAPTQTISNKAPYFTDYVKAELLRQLKDKESGDEGLPSGFRIYTTLDVRMNTLAQRAIADGIIELEKKGDSSKKGQPQGERPRLEGALASIDHNTGYIRSLIGGRSYSESTFNRILNMKRQVGSTFKPIVYLAAFEKGKDAEGVSYGPGHPAEDGPWKLVYDRGRQTWSPKNYEKEFKGWVSYRTALAHSVNTVTAKLGVEVGIDPIIEKARALGIESDLPKVPSLALGVAELSPVELLRAYSAIANHGVQQELTVIRGITYDDGRLFARFVPRSNPVAQPGPSDLLIDMLQTVFQEGTASSALALGFDRPAAGKTGTTSHHRDSWFAGFTPQLTTVVWVGTDVDQPQQKTPYRLTGGGSALPIWVRFMKQALDGIAPDTFPESSHLTQVKINRQSGKLALDDCPDTHVLLEKYSSGNEPEVAACDILWPASETTTKLD